MSKNIDTQQDEVFFEVTHQGSLGLLAYGDIGLRAWRKVKKEAREDELHEKE